MGQEATEDASKTGGKKRVAVLLACHNRRELTLRALRSLDNARDVFELCVVLFEDGSTDGTADAVREQFPDTIIVSGDGSAFWNGGMHRAWTRALELEPDAYLWLNDDVALDPDALARLNGAWAEAEAMREDGAFVLVGATRDQQGDYTYGGWFKPSRFSLRLVKVGETATLTRIDTFNGNIVLVTAPTVARIGINDPSYFHMYGDIDYGLRASRAGIPALQLPGTLGVCEWNPGANLSAMPLSARWNHLLRSPRGFRPKSWWHFARKHSGLLAPLHFISPYRMLFYPRSWLPKQ